MNRREWLAGAAGLAAVSATVGQEKNPAAQVADRSSSIRITGLKAFWVNSHVFLRIETNHGIVGWGDVKGVDPRVAKPLAESLYELIDGENPTSEILARWNVDYVLVDLRDQAAIAPAILGQPGLRVVYRGPRFVILRVER